jgi:hypothetical protein
MSGKDFAPRSGWEGHCDTASASSGSGNATKMISGRRS